jgi:hypothetical protein
MLTRDEFHQLEQRITSAWHSRDHSNAFADIETILREGSVEMKGEALLLAGMIRESEGDLKGAQQHWREALLLAPEGTFLRYSLEDELGKISEKTDAENAVFWYRAALKTCSNGDEFAAIPTLGSFLRLNSGNISQEDRALVASVLQKSWRVLDLPGGPNPDDLVGSVATLTGRFDEMLSGIKNES